MEIPTFACNTLSQIHLNITKTPHRHPLKPLHLQTFTPIKLSLHQTHRVTTDDGSEGQKFKWVEIGPNITQPQNQEISKLPFKMSKRCKALMKQIICFNPSQKSQSESELWGLLDAWVKVMKPRRADWLVVLKEMSKSEHPLLFEVIKFAFLEESFEANTRDYTKLIDNYAKKNQLQGAENIVQDMKIRGFTCDQVTLTVLIHMYSKAGNLNRAEETFEEIKLLGLPLDKRSYGSMIMAYIRAGMNERGESVLREMEAQEMYAGTEIYKALLRAYSTAGDINGAQRVFDSIQFAGIAPDTRICALLMNAYMVAGDSEGVRSVFVNLRSAGLEPNDKCVTIMLSVYEKENKLNMALELLMDLERDGIMVGEEASEVLAKWFRRLGVVKEVELVLREYANREYSEPAL
ncbi:hypothetical protein GIB67_010650 [Kingdonia uniflora]|uniref:PROP1-like PPR domain-containing protein n=1 Tax=Kingdonia uniflora TaxID=39325 RepID=A0A7J7MMS3_9MAGN|nr:hypothetical protein GIB67_010650 [Kingdonia uniflora]